MRSSANMKEKWDIGDMKRKCVLAALLAAFLAGLCACAVVPETAEQAQPQAALELPAEEAPDLAETVESAKVAESAAPRYIEPEIVTSARGPSGDAQQMKGTAAEEAESEEAKLEETAEVEASDLLSGILLEEKAQRLVVIDTGHQAEGNYATEPIGPGASEQKVKVAAGTRGVVSGLQEYELTLQVSLLLQKELEARGYEVVLTRTAHDVDISNAERAAVANELAADAFIRVHANGSQSEAANGAMTICQTADNPYNAEWYEQSYALSSCVLDALTEKTGCKKEYIWQTDTMAGINWAQMPVTIVEIGYMTNPDEDALMATRDYQQKIAEGIADGIDAYFAAQTQ